MDKCHKGDHQAIEANHKVIDELQKQLADYIAKNKRLKEFALKLVEEEGELDDLDYWAEEYLHAYKQLANINEIETENKRLREAIEAALRISDLWTLKEVETMFEDEAKALLEMKNRFQQALKGKK